MEHPFPGARKPNDLRRNRDSRRTPLDHHRKRIGNRDKSSYRIASWLTALARCKMTRYLEESQHAAFIQLIGMNLRQRLASLVSTLEEPVVRLSGPP
jgi:hypothetical protein